MGQLFISKELEAFEEVTREKGPEEPQDLLCTPTVLLWSSEPPGVAQ